MRPHLELHATTVCDAPDSSNVSFKSTIVSFTSTRALASTLLACSSPVLTARHRCSWLSS